MALEIGTDQLGGAPLGADDIQIEPPAPGPCSPFATVDDLLARPDCAGKNATPEMADYAVTAASYALWAATGRQFDNGCVRTLRPCCGSCLDDAIHPVLSRGAWYNVRGRGYGCLAYDCATITPRVDLGHYPVVEALVTIDGTQLSGSAYRLDRWRHLVRTDGDAWPTTNSLVLPEGPGVWSVRIVYGRPPPAYVVGATLDLAAELLKAVCGEECAFPFGTVRSMVRQGIQYTFGDVLGAIAEGRTGIASVDMAILAVNPEGLHEAPRVISPDRHGHPVVGP